MIKVLQAFDSIRYGDSSDDPDIEGNSIIFSAIKEFRAETTHENLANVVQTFCQRIKEGGRAIVPVIAPQALTEKLDLDHVAVGDEFTADEAEVFQGI